MLVVPIEMAKEEQRYRAGVHENYNDELKRTHNTQRFVSSLAAAIYVASLVLVLLLGGNVYLTGTIALGIPLVGILGNIQNIFFRNKDDN